MKWHRLGMVCVVAGVALFTVTGSRAPAGGCGPGPSRAAAATGRVQWSTEIVANHQVSGTAAVGPLLYVPTAVLGTAEQEEHDNRVTAYDPRDGRVRWIQDGVLDSLSGAVFVGGESGKLLIAVEPLDGRWRWAHLAPGTPGVGLAPGGMHALSGPGVLVASSWDGYVARLDPAEGTALWTLAEPPYAVREVTLSGDTIYVDGTMGIVSARGFEIAAVDAGSGQVRWRRSGTEPSLLGATTLVERGGRLVVVLGSEVLDGPSSLTVIDSRTGADLWSTVLGRYVHPFEDTYADLLAHGVVHSYAGRLAMYDVDTGMVRWELDTDAQREHRERNRSHAPGLIRPLPGGLLTNGDDEVLCLDPATGVVRWRAPTGIPFINEIQVAGGVVYASGLRNPLGEDHAPVSYVQALDLRTGHRIWRYETRGSGTLLACTPDAVFVAAEGAVQRIGP